MHHLVILATNYMYIIAINGITMTMDLEGIDEQSVNNCGYISAFRLAYYLSFLSSSIVLQSNHYKQLSELPPYII